MQAKRSEGLAMHQDVERILFTEDEIAARVAEIGAGLSEDFKDAEDGIVLISVLRGAAIFMADLARQITIPCEMVTWPCLPTATARKAPASSAF